MPHATHSRRQFLQTSLATGAAAAVTPYWLTSSTPKRKTLPAPIGTRWLHRHRRPASWGGDRAGEAIDECFGGVRCRQEALGKRKPAGRE